MEFLKDILGEELYTQVEGKVSTHNAGISDESKRVKLADLSTGNYVSKEKHLSLKTERDGYKTQLETANGEIASYKNLDIDGIKQAAANWETKYNDDIGKLNQTLLNQQMEFSAKEYMNKQGFKSELAKEAAVSKLLGQKLPFKDGVFTGADEFMKKLKEADPDSFAPAEDKQQNKSWVRGTGNTHKPPVIGDEQAYMDRKYKGNKYYKG